MTGNVLPVFRVSVVMVLPARVKVFAAFRRRVYPLTPDVVASRTHLCIRPQNTAAATAFMGRVMKQRQIS